MVKPLTDTEQRLLQAAFAFEQMALAPTSESIEAVENLFRSFQLPGQVWHTIQPAPPSPNQADGQRWKEDCKRAVVAFRDDQEKLRGWLVKISRTGRLDNKERDIVAGVIQRTVRGGPPRIVFPERGKLQVEFDLLFEGVEAHFAYAVGLLLDARNLGQELRRCKHKHCNKFFIRKRTDQEYCVPSHGNNARALKSQKSKRRK